MLTHMHPSQCWFTCRPRPIFNGPVIPAQSPGPAKTHQVPRAPLPARGVTSPGMASRTKSAGITPPSSLLLAHAPDQIPPTAYGHCLGRRVFAGCRQSLLEDGPSRRYLCNLCIGAWTLTPQCPFGALARFFPKDIGLTLDLRRSAHPHSPCNATSTRHAISGLQSFRYVQAPILARPPGCTHLWKTIRFPGRPGRLHHAMNVGLPSTNCGIATHLNRAIDVTGLSPARLQPCRLLPRPLRECRDGFCHWRRRCNGSD